MINLGMHEIARTMELRPLQFFYLMSFDQRNLCNGRMLALVVQSFSKHILDAESARRQKPNAVEIQVPSVLREETAESRADGANKIKLAFCAFDLLSKAPTLDLAYGTLMHFASDPKYETWIVVRTLLTEQQGRNGECPYDASYPPAVALATRFADRIVYLWSDWKDDKIVRAMRMRHYSIIMHLNGLNHGHLWSALVMAELAEMYIEWLSLASLLMSMLLAHWTITGSELVTQTQLGMPGRGAVLSIPYP
jgi:hypothetical protein